MSLPDLERQVHGELELFAYPDRDWIEPRCPASHDVVIVGAGMAGLAAAIALARERIANVIVLDRNPSGREGPWDTFARMPTLRTEKRLTGPDAAIASLTFRRWYEAQFGDAAYRALGLIDKGDWMGYLVWLRRVMNVHVANGAEVTDIAVDCGALRVSVKRADRRETLRARRVVLATGYDGQGIPRIPEPLAALDRRWWAHTRDPIDFARLRGKRVGVLGAGASAFDNSATALEAGAHEVVQFVRRPVLPQVNWMRFAEFAGYFRGYPELDDERRARFTRRIFSMPTPPPQETLVRVLRHPNFALRMGAPWLGVHPHGDAVSVATPAGTEAFDFLIAGTGFALDLAARPELAGVVPQIAFWRDRYAGAAAPGDPLGGFPYLGPGFEFVPRNAHAPAELGHIHLIGPAALASHGAICVGLNGMRHAVARLTDAIARSFFIEDADRYDAAFARFAEPESDIATARAAAAQRRVTP